MLTCVREGTHNLISDDWGRSRLVKDQETINKILQRRGGGKEGEGKGKAHTGLSEGIFKKGAQHRAKQPLHRGGWPKDTPFL